MSLLRNLLLASLVLTRTAAGADSEVGDSGLPDHLIFSGNTTFSDTDLREYLSWDVPYYFASRPFSSLDSLLALVSERLSASYREAGFLDAQVKTVVDGDVIRIGISEGQRFAAGTITVSGLSGDLERWLIARLEQPIPEPRFTVNPARPSTSSIKHPWQVGQHLFPSDQDLIEKQVRSWIADIGYPSANVHASLMRHGKAINLALGIEPGPVAHLDEVVVDGLTSTDRAAFDRFLSLPVAQPFSQAQARQVEDTLRASGRFAQEHAAFATIPGTDKHRLTITIVESRNIPHLPEALSPADEVALRTTMSLNDRLYAGTEDLVLEMVIVTPFLRMKVRSVCSPLHGIAFQYYAGPDPTPLNLALACVDGRLLIWDSAGHGSVIADRCSPYITAALTGRQLAPGEIIQETSGDPGTITSELGCSISSSDSPMQWNVRLDPAQVLSFLHRSEATVHTDGEVVSASIGSLRWRLDQKLNRLLGLSLEAAPTDPGWIRSLTIHTEPHALQALTSEPIPSPLMQAPKSSGIDAVGAVRLVVEAVRAHADVLTEPLLKQVCTAFGALGDLATDDLIKRIASATFGDVGLPGSELFPEGDAYDTSQETLIGRTALAFIHAYHHLAEKTGPRAWPASFMRLLIAMLRNDGEGTRLEWPIVHDAAHIGPISCVFLSTFLGFQPDSATYFAKCGLNRLDAAGIVKDLALLHRFAPVIVDMLAGAKDDQLKLLFDPALGDALQRAQEDLRRNRQAGKNPTQLIDIWFKSFWYAGGRNACELRLRQIAEPAATSVP